MNTSSIVTVQPDLLKQDWNMSKAEQNIKGNAAEKLSPHQNIEGIAQSNTVTMKQFVIDDQKKMRQC